MKNIYIFCEGKTEYNYIQSLNRFLEESNIFGIHFTAKNLEGVKINNYYAKITKYKTKDLKVFTDFYAWLDYDIFKRKNNTDVEIKDKIGKILFNKKSVKLLLNYMNGEDFIILNEENDKIQQWLKVCNEKNHFSSPMQSDEYMCLFKTIMPKYKKGENLKIDDEKIKTCIKNINDNNTPFKSDIKEILEEIINLLSII